jgi:hypothetical protein
LVASLSSLLSWDEIREKLAKMLNIYPGSLHAQYRFSTDSKGSYPYDLMNPEQLSSMLTILQPLVAPRCLASGCMSAPPRKPATVLIFNKPGPSDNLETGVQESGVRKVSHIT